MVEESTVADDDWRSGPDWVAHLAEEVGRALVASDEGEMLELLKEVDALLSSGNENVAVLVTQAALYRSVLGPVTKKAFDAKQVTDAVHFDALLAEATVVDDRSQLLAEALGAAGRVSVKQREYQRGRDVHLAAAKIWAERGDLSREALCLLRAGAAACHLDDVDDALQISGRARDVFAGIGDAEGVIWATLNLAQARNLIGDADAARELLEQARTLSRGKRDGHISSSILLEEAILEAEAGDVAAARDRFRAVYRSGRRRRDYDQALTAAKNLAVLANEGAQPRREIHWWEAASALAGELHDWREQQDIERARGVALARNGQYDEAMSAFDRAIETNDEHDNAIDSARSHADKGAVALDHAAKGDVSDERFDELTELAVEILDMARRELELLGDFEWAAIAVRNLRTGWILRKTEAEGAAVLIDAAEHLRADADYSVELRRNAAWLLLAAGTAAEDDARPAEWLVDAATLSSADRVERAWSLAKQAATLTARGFDQAALRLYDVALEGLSPSDDASVFGNILNDSVLTIDQENGLDDVRRRLLRVEQIARETDDRVLLSLALSNLGETAVRLDDVEDARRYFTAAVQLAEDLGDDARAAIALASLSNTYVSDDRPDDADRASERALELAAQSGSEEAWVRATSASASAAFLRGDFEAAYRGWEACVTREAIEDSGEHQAYALDSLAQLGNWPRFRRELERYARQSQKADAQFAFVDKLHMSALTWLRNNNPSAAGTVLAYGVRLAFEAASKLYGRRGRALSTADRERALVRVGSAMGPARAVFVLLELPEKDTRAVRRAYERSIRRAAGEHADELLEAVDRQIRAGDETEV